MYEVQIDRRAEKAMVRLPTDVLQRIVRNISNLSQDPQPPGCRKIIGAESDWRIRIGDYRVVYEILTSERIVRVFKVGHRKDVYQ